MKEHYLDERKLMLWAYGSQMSEHCAIIASTDTIAIKSFKCDRSTTLRHPERIWIANAVVAAFCQVERCYQGDPKC